MTNSPLPIRLETIWYVTPTQTYELEPVFTYHTDEDDEEVRQLSNPRLC